ncbi:MAG: hypothetical protein JXM69_14470 [Anaerolineae bacterium]|nr:hypothetical protein [Anaerolineae bacterium]
MSQPSYPKNSDLGTLQANYETNPAHARDLLGFIVLFALAGLVVLVMGVTQNDIRNQLLIGGGGLLLLAVGMRIYFAFRGRLNVSAAVYDNGFIFTDRRRRPISCRWDDITEVYETITYSGRRMSHPRWWAYTVQQSGGQSVRLDNAIKGVRSLGLTLQQEVDKRLLPQAIAAYKAGETVAFGPHLGLNRQGLVAGSKLLPWEQVTEIKFSQMGNLQIHQKGRLRAWLTIIHSKIANYPTLKAMMRQAVELNPSATPPVIHDASQRPVPSTQPADIAQGNIGSISARLGVDVRELLMEGYTMTDIQGVLQGEYDLDELRRRKPGRAARKRK